MPEHLVDRLGASQIFCEQCGAQEMGIVRCGPKDLPDWEIRIGKTCDDFVTDLDDTSVTLLVARNEISLVGDGIDCLARGQPKWHLFAGHLQH